MSRVTHLDVNGTARPCDADAARPLLSVLRDDLGLTGTKYGCGEGQCGACTVHVEGVPVRSCLAPVGSIGRQKITTIEGLENAGWLHALQEAFLKDGAMQCAYCTPGMIMSGAALLAKNPDPTDEEIIRFMDGNICRCGVYPRILAAIKRAAVALKGGLK